MGFVFVKPHRVGSTTYRVIFERYGERRGLRALRFQEWPLVPRGGENLLPDIGETVSPPYDISARHIAYQPDWISQFVPDPVFVTLARHPLTRAVSQYHSFVRERRYANVGFEEWYLDIGKDAVWPGIPTEHVSSPDEAMEYVEAVRSCFNDYYAYWFGFGHDEEITREGLEDRFAALGVTERYDESLAVMRRRLDWDLEDVMYSGAIATGGSVGVHPPYRADHTPVRADVVAMFEERNVRDYRIYELANEMLDDALRDGGDGLHEEVTLVAAEYQRSVPPQLRALKPGQHR